MDFPALVQRIVYPHTDTPERAWDTAGNSWVAGTILALNRLLGGTWTLSATPLVGPALVKVGIGFLFVLLSLLAYRRSRIASGAILILAVFEVLIEVLFAVILNATYSFNLLVVSVALVLAFGGFRGATAIFAHYRKSRS